MFMCIIVQSLQRVKFNKVADIWMQAFSIALITRVLSAVVDLRA